MNLQLVGRVLEVKQTDKYLYVTMNDTKEGGSVKMAFPLNVQVKIDQLLNVNAIVKPGIGKYGLYLTVLQLLNTESNEKGEK